MQECSQSVVIVRVNEILERQLIFKPLTDHFFCMCRRKPESIPPQKLCNCLKKFFFYIFQYFSKGILFIYLFYFFLHLFIFTSSRNNHNNFCTFMQIFSELSREKSCYPTLEFQFFKFVQKMN